MKGSKATTSQVHFYNGGETEESEEGATGTERGEVILLFGGWLRFY